MLLSRDEDKTYAKPLKQDGSKEFQVADWKAGHKKVYNEFKRWASRMLCLEPRRVDDDDDTKDTRSNAIT
jgi:hypothetical protein